MHRAIAMIGLLCRDFDMPPPKLRPKVSGAETSSRHQNSSEGAVRARVRIRWSRTDGVPTDLKAIGFQPGNDVQSVPRLKRPRTSSSECVFVVAATATTCRCRSAAKDGQALPELLITQGSETG